MRKYYNEQREKRKEKKRLKKEKKHCDKHNGCDCDNVYCKYHREHWFRWVPVPRGLWRTFK